MFTIEWLARDGAVVDSAVTVADDIDLAHGKALGRAIYQARKHVAPPASYRILNADGHQVAAAPLPPDMLVGKWTPAASNSL